MAKQRLAHKAPTPGWQAAPIRRADRRSLLASTAFAAFVGAGLFAFGAPVLAQTPTGGVVTAGSATITQNSATQLTVNQTTNRGVIDWQSFNIGAGARVDFVQPSASSVTLNRVVGPDPSLINGQLNANGQVILINPSGVTFGNGAQVNVHSLIAGTANVANTSDFMAGGKVVFGQASANPGAAVVNNGTITVKEGGLVGLVGPNAANNGVINAKLGRVTIGGSETMTVDLAGDGLLGLQIGPATKVAARAANTGTINAPGGTVTISAATARNVVDSITNVQGMVKATTVSIEGGAVVFGAEVDVSSATAKGGTVTATGTQVTVQSTARINANGATGGGTVLIGGGKQGAGPIANAQNTTVDKGAAITASATGKGDGGTVVVWADNTTVFAGTIEARGGALGGDGGFVETSGKANLSVTKDASVNAGAPLGRAGMWLLDPRSVRIITGGTGGLTTPDGPGTYDIDPGTIQTALASTNVTISTAADGDGADLGNITVLNAITWNSASTLTFNADNNIAINAAINGGNGTLALNAGLGTATGTITQTADIGVNTLTVSTQGGNAILDQVNGIANLGASNLGSGALSVRTNTLTFTVTGDIVASGGITLRNGIWIVLNAAVNAGAGTVSLLGFGSEADSIRQSAAGVITAGTLTITGGGGASLGTATNQITKLGAVSLGSGVLSLKDAGGLTLSGTVTAKGGITLETSGTLSDGAQTVDASAGTLTLTTTGGSANTIGFGGATSAGTLVLTTANANASLTNSFDTIGNLGATSLGSGSLFILQSAALTVSGAVAAGGVNLNTSNGVTVNSTLNAGSGTVTLAGGSGGVTQGAAGTITAGTLNLGASNANATLNAATNAITSLGSVSLGNGALSLLDAGGLFIGNNVTAKGGITISTSGALSSSSAVVDAGSATVSLTTTGSGNAISISGPLAAGTLSFTTTNANATLFNGFSNITNLGTVSIGTGTLNVLDANGVTVSGAVSAGSATINTGGLLAINNTINVGAGSLSLLTADTGNAITQSAAITAGTLNITTGNANATLNGATNSVAAIGTVSIGSGAFALKTGAASGFTVSAGSITANGGISVENTAGNLTTSGTLQASSGAVSLIASAAGKTITLGGAVNGLGVSLKSDGALAIGQSINAGTGTASLTVTGASNAITQSAGTLTAGTLSISTNDGNATLGQANLITNIGTSNVGMGALSVTDSAGGLTVTGTISTFGGTVLSTVGDLTIQATMNSGGGATVLNATGNITQTAAAVITADILRASTGGTGTIDLSSATNVIGALGTVSSPTSFSFKTNAATLNVTETITATASDVTLVNTGGAIRMIAPINAGATVSLTAAGNIFHTAAGPISAATLALATSGGGNVTLNAATNTIANLGAVSLGGGSLDLLDAGGLTVTGAVAAGGGITISTSGALAINSALNGGTGTVSLTATGPGSGITQSVDGVITAGTLTLSSDGTVDLTTAANLVSNLGASTVDALFMHDEVPTFTVSGALAALNVALENTGAIVVGAPINVPDNPVRLRTLDGPSSTITQTAAGVITAGVLDLLTNDASATLDAATNVVQYQDYVVLGAGALTLRTDAAAGFTIDGDRVVANGGIAITNTSGAITTINALSAGAGAVSLTAATTLFIGGTLSGVGVSLQSLDALSLAQSIDAGSGTALLVVNGSGNAITQSAGTITAATLSVSTNRGDATLNQTNAVTNLGAVSLITGALSLTDSGGLTVSGTVSASGGITLSTSGALAVDQALSAGTGAVSLTTTGGASSTITQGGSGVISTASLGLSTAGADALLDSATNAVTSLSGVSLGAGRFALKTAASGGFTVSGASITAGGGIAVENTTGSITTVGALGAASGAVSLTAIASGKGITLGGTVSGVGVSLKANAALSINQAINAGAGTASLETTGSGSTITATAAITATTLSVTTQNGEVVLNQNNALTNLGAVSTGTGDFSLFDLGGLTVTGAVASNRITLNTTGTLDIRNTLTTVNTATLTGSTGITQTAGGVIDAGVLRLTTTNADATLDTATNIVSQIAAGLGNGALALKSNTGSLSVVAPGITANGGVTLTNTGTITQFSGGVITTSGALSLATTNANATLNAATNAIGSLGTVALGSGALNLLDAGGLTVSGAVGATGGITLSTSGALTINAALNAGAGSVALSATAAGDIGQGASGVITSGTLTANASSGQVALDGATNQVSALGASGASGDFRLLTGVAGGLSITGDVSGGSLDIRNNAGGIGATAKLFSGTQLTLDAAGDLTTGAGQAKANGSMSLTASGNVSIGSGGAAATDTIAFNLSGSGKTITQSGALSANLLSISTTDGDATLTNSGNAINNLGSVGMGSGALQLVDVGGLTVSGAVAAGGVGLSTSGALAIDNTLNAGTGSVALTTTSSGAGISQNSSGVITAGILTLTTTNADATLDSATNAITNLGAVSLGTGALVLLDAGGLTVSGAVAAGGGITLTSSGALAINGTLNAGTVSLGTTGSGNAISQTAAISADTLTLSTTDANATLDGATNAIATLDTVSLGAGSFRLLNAGALAVAGKGIAAQGGVAIRAGGAITLGGGIDSGSAITALQASAGDVVQGKGTIASGALLAVADAGMVDLRNEGNAVSGAVAGAAATSFLFSNSLGITVQAGGVAPGALIGARTGITANTAGNAGGFVVDLAASGGDILVQGAVSSDKGMIVYRRTAANTTGAITLAGTAANTLGDARLLVIDLSGATGAALYGTTPDTALGGVFTTPTPASGTAGYALGGLTGGTVSLGAGFSGATSTIYLGGMSATFSGGSAAARFGLLGVYGSNNAATLQGTVGNIAPGDTSAAPASRSFSGVTQVGGTGAAQLVRADASNARMTFNGCQIGGLLCAIPRDVVGTDFVASLRIVDVFQQGGPAITGWEEELDFDNRADSEPADDRKKKGKGRAGPFGLRP